MIPTDSGHRKDESYGPKIFLEKNLANQIILNILMILTKKFQPRKLKNKRIDHQSF